MDFHENTALLDAFVDGELTGEEMLQVQSHLVECPACRAYVDDALAIRAAFPGEDAPALPGDFTEMVMQTVAKMPQSRPKKQPWGKLAAAAACLAIIVLVQHTGGITSGSSNQSPAAYSAETADTCASASAGDAETETESYAEACKIPDTAADGTDSASAPAADTGNAKSRKSESPANGAVPSQQARPVETENAVVPSDPSDSAPEAALPTVRISSAELGDLLDGRTPEETDASGTKRYLLTRLEFDALAETLAGQDVTLECDDAESAQLWLEVYDA